MKVTKCEIQQKNKEKVNIYIDDKYSFSMTVNGMLAENVRVGIELTEEDIERLKKQDNPKLAYMYAIYLLGFGMKTEKELKDKLKKKGYDETSIDYAIEKAKSYNYINDENYVDTFIRTRAIPSSWGENKIISTLLQKGIDKNVIKEKIEELYNSDDKYENALNLAIKKKNTLSKYDEKKQKERIYSFLTSKGFKYDTIKKVLSTIFSEDFFED